MWYTKLELSWTSLQGFCDHNWHFCQCTWISLEFRISHQVAGRQLWRQVAGASQFAGFLCATRRILVMTSECSTLTIRGAGLAYCPEPTHETPSRAQQWCDTGLLLQTCSLRMPALPSKTSVCSAQISLTLKMVTKTCQSHLGLKTHQNCLFPV